MRKVCVITGGGSGIGLATARKLVQQDYYVILTGRTESKLSDAVTGLQTLGGEAEAFGCDIADPVRTAELAVYAAQQGEVKAVIHAAGLSPHMADAKTILECNALGTVNINDAFYEVMSPGGCLIDTSSMSAYMVPNILIPRKLYGLCRTDRDRFMHKMLARVNLFPNKHRTGIAYSLSKHFVIWYARTDAARFGEKGVRVLSVTPGNFETPMGNLEKEEGSDFVQYNAIKRFGKPKEIAQLYAFLIDERLGYLTGTDILCDGGCIASAANPLAKAII